jgi:hypothetical protein
VLVRVSGQPCLAIAWQLQSQGLALYFLVAPVFLDRVLLVLSMSSSLAWLLLSAVPCVSSLPQLVSAQLSEKNGASASLPSTAPSQLHLRACTNALLSRSVACSFLCKVHAQGAWASARASKCTVALLASSITTCTAWLLGKLRQRVQTHTRACHDARIVMLVAKRLWRLILSRESVWHFSPVALPSERLQTLLLLCRDWPLLRAVLDKWLPQRSARKRCKRAWFIKLLFCGVPVSFAAVRRQGLVQTMTSAIAHVVRDLWQEGRVMLRAALLLMLCTGAAADSSAALVEHASALRSDG